MEKYQMSVPIRPVVDDTSMPYWESLRNKDIKLQKCLQCGKLRFPPYPTCPFCGFQGDKWVPVSGRGKLYSWIVVHAPINPALEEDVPYTVGLVELDEGPRIAGRIVGCSPLDLKKDMRVRPNYKVVDEELTLLTFEPLDEK